MQPSTWSGTGITAELCTAGTLLLAPSSLLLWKGLTEQTGMSRSTMAPLGQEQQQGGSKLQEIRVCSKPGTWHGVDGMG